ncbi:MAG: glycosyltransferase [Pseudomonadota bacterium]
MKEIIMVVFGTKGDLHPFIGVGRELKSRGHNVTVVSNEIYNRDVVSAGLKFFSAGSNLDYQKSIGSGRIFNSMEEYTHVIGDAIRKPMFRVEYEFVASRFKKNKNVLVIVSRFDNGACLACEKLKIPMIRLCLSPMHLKITNPVPEQFKLQMQKSYSIGFINEFREAYDLEPIRDFHYFDDFSLCDIALFPEWFADLDQEEKPAALFFSGFPLYDVPITKNTDRFLEHVGKYGQPIIFMMDTCIAGSKSFFETSVKICEEFFYPGVIVTHDKNAIPENLSENVLWLDYIDMKSSLQNALLIVHTGGIGTVARAMESGVPQLIVPRYSDNDHVDNALKSALFGSGGCVSIDEYSADFVPKIIYSMLYKEKLKSMREEILNDINSKNGIDITCDLILEASS